MIERGTVTVLSGAKSTMKSMLGHGLTAALVLGRECYLGRPIAPGPVLVIDAENPDGVAQDRLGSLGVGPEHWNPELLRYVGRPTERGQRTPRIGDPYWNDWLAREIADFEPALLVVDGSLTATNVRKVSDEDRVEALFDVLRDAIQGHPTAVLLYHHERKPSVEVGRGSAADALIGSVYWTNLPDTGYALARKAQEKTDADDGAGYRLRTISELEVTKEHRRAAPPEPFCWVADTIFDRDGTPRHCEIALTDNPDALIVRDALAEMVSENGAVVKRKDLAAHMGTRSDDTTFDRRLQAALAAGLVVKPEYGKYALPAESHGPALD